MSEAVETSTTSFRQRKWHHRRDARFVLAVAAFIVLFYSWGFINGPDRIDAEGHIGAAEKALRRVYRTADDFIELSPTFSPTGFQDLAEAMGLDASGSEDPIEEATRDGVILASERRP